jgi:hypothetical protein
VQEGAANAASEASVAAQSAARSAARSAAAAAESTAQSAAAAAQSTAQSAAAAAQSTAQSAAQQAAQRAQQAAAGINEGLRAGTVSARNWVAPRLETVADYTTSTVAPAVSDAVVHTVAPRVAAALRTTAKQVSVEPPRRSKVRSVLTWTALTTAVLAGAAAAGTVVWRRYRAAMAADTEPDVAMPGTDDVTAAGGAAAATDAPAAGKADLADDATSQNGTAPHSAKSNW